MKKKATNKKKLIFRILIITLILPFLYVGLTHFEGEKPSVSTDLLLASIGASGELTATISDQKSGLRHAWFALSKDGTEKILAQKDYTADGFFSKGTQKQDVFSIIIEPEKLGFKDGIAKLRIRVSDYSWRGWFNGNVTYLEKELIIDTEPPEINVLSRNHNLKRGGSGLIIYQVTGKAIRTGVVVGKNFYPGYSGYFENPEVYLAFFALSHKQNTSTTIYLEAFDEAGNNSRAGFNHYIGAKTFKNDRINISDGFLNAHMPGFKLDGHYQSNIEKFLTINSDVRKKNGATIMAVNSKPDKTLRWKGAFSRLPGSANRANYADHRSYRYKGKVIDRQYHLGIDLASIKRAPVPAANTGRVALIKTIGIYGKTIVIDHGFGLFSTYSHLSSVEVTEDQMVSKNDIIGRTGVTGLVGGDHLHFGMFVHNTFVNPVEWWDASWIKNNITSKITAARSEL